MPAMTASAIVKEFGVPPGLTTEKAVRVEPNPDEETTDNGSSLSDNEASSTSESTEAMHPAMRSFLTPPAANRRSALQQAGDKVLGNMVLPPASANNSRKKGAAKAKAPLTNAAKAPLSNDRVQTMANRRGPAVVASQPAVVASQDKPMRQTQIPYIDSSYQAPDMAMPMKVSMCASFNIDLVAPLHTLDPLLPAKKRPIFDCEAGHVRAFDRSAPLKKRVPEHLLQDPVHVVSF
jgi:hypothetical protein